MKVVITVNFCYDNPWKSKFMALEQTGKLGTFSPILWPLTHWLPTLTHSDAASCVVLVYSSGSGGVSSSLASVITQSCSGSISACPPSASVRAQPNDLLITTPTTSTTAPSSCAQACYSPEHAADDLRTKSTSSAPQQLVSVAGQKFPSSSPADGARAVADTGNFPPSLPVSGASSAQSQLCSMSLNNVAVTETAAASSLQAAVNSKPAVMNTTASLGHVSIEYLPTL